MSYAVNSWASADWSADGADTSAPVVVSVAITESSDDVFSANATAVPHAIAISVSVTESGDDVFSANIIQPEGSDLGEPITLGEAKLAARLDSSIRIFDTDIARSVTAARLLAEQSTGREFVRKTKRFSFPDFPNATTVLNVFEPVAVAISWWTGSSWQAMDVADYAYWEQGCGTGIGPAVGKSWPTLGAVAGGPRVRVDITAGPADPRAATPADVKLYIAAMVAHWHDKPSAVGDRTDAPSPYINRLLDAARLYN